MNDLIQLGISQLQNVKTREEAHRAGLQDKWHLEKLHLSWKDINLNMSDVEYDSDDSDGYVSSMTSEPSTSIEIEEWSPVEVHVGLESSSSGVEMEERLLTQVHEILETSTSTEMEEHSPAEVLEGLRPYNNLKHLQISEYTGATSPSWLASNTPVTSLQTLHLENCGEWQILPSLEGLPFLAKLSLSNMTKVKEVSVPSLEELVLIEMPKLERCSCISVRVLNSCLRVLKIKKCPALKVFDLFGNGLKFKTEQKSWLPHLRELTLKNCRLLVVPHPLPSSSTVSTISMGGVTKFPRIELSSFGERHLTIGGNFDFEFYGDEEVPFDKLCDGLSVLDGNILAFHNLRFLTQLIICGWRKLTSISLEGLSQFESLKKLIIEGCPGLSRFDAPPEHAHEDLKAANFNALPSLEYLEIWSCGIAWEWLSLILQHVPALTELDVQNCPNLESLQLNSQHVPALTELDVQNCPNLESLQLNSCTALEKLKVRACESLGALDVLQSRSLRDMEVELVPKLKSLQLHFCTALEELAIRVTALCVLEGSQSLRKLELYNNQYLESLQLHSCTALEELNIQICPSLCTLEGFQSLGSLTHLYLRACPGLHSCLEGLPVQDYELCPQLEVLYINDFSFLATSFCKQLTSLQRLVLWGFVEETTAEGLTDEQERGLLLLGSLTELRFDNYKHLKYLPAGLHGLRSLLVLEISFCPSISGLPALPPSLEDLRISWSSEELKRQSKLLASSELKVEIDSHYVN